MNHYSASVLVLFLLAGIYGCGERQRKEFNSNTPTEVLPKTNGRQYTKAYSNLYWLMAPELLRAKSYRTRLYMMNSNSLAYSLYTKGDWLFNGKDALIVNNTCYFLEAGDCDDTSVCLYLNGEMVANYPVGCDELARWRMLYLNNESFVKQTDTQHDTPSDETTMVLRMMSLRDSVFTDSVASAVRHYPPDFYRTPAILLRKGDFVSRLGFYREAVLFYDAVITHFPKEPIAYFSRAELYYDYLGRRAEARHDYRTYVALMRQQGKDVASAHINQRLKDDLPSVEQR